MKHAIGLLIFGIILCACNSSTSVKKEKERYKTEDLVINQVSTHVYEHTSFLNTQDFGRVPCNGMIVIDENEAVVFDTPADDQTAQELISFINKELHCKIVATVATHFHMDCLGGLSAFHDHHIPSYAYSLTIDLAREKGFPVPKQAFDEGLMLHVGSKSVYAAFMGAGHTKDNVIGYFPAEKILFGGCLVKEIGAGKGNLEDADTAQWASTVEKVRSKYPETSIVIPGHGKSGDSELLEYTINLFE